MDSQGQWCKCLGKETMVVAWIMCLKGIVIMVFLMMAASQHDQNGGVVDSAADWYQTDG